LRVDHFKNGTFLINRLVQDLPTQIIPGRHRLAVNTAHLLTAMYVRDSGRRAGCGLPKIGSNSLLPTMKTPQ
jgi:hypothetical protein